MNEKLRELHDPERTKKSNVRKEFDKTEDSVLFSGPKIYIVFHQCLSFYINKYMYVLKLKSSVILTLLTSSHFWTLFKIQKSSNLFLNSSF